MTKTIDEKRAEYRSIRRGFMREDSTLTAEEFDVRCRNHFKFTNADLASQFLGATRYVTTRCGRCAGTGAFITYVENGQPKGPGGICFRCGGKGYQDFSDVKRNETHDQHYMGTESGELGRDLPCEDEDMYDDADAFHAEYDC